MAITVALRSLLFLTLLLVSSTNLFAITRFDFDGDFRADLAVFRPSNGLWLILDSQSGTLRQVAFGQNGDVPLDADFDGDLKADVSVWRPSDGTWWFQRSSDQTYGGVQWGQNGDMPVTGDYDADGRTDFAVWRPSDGINYIVRSSGGYLGVQWGMQGDIPEHWDRNLDGKTDFAVYRPSNGKWYTLVNGDSAFGQIDFGAPGDIPVKGDFDGDQIGDFAVYRPSTGTFWYAASSQGNAHRATVWGFATDTPVPADYDGDGRADVSVWRPANGTWYSVNSGGGFGTTELGAGGDIPLPAPQLSAIASLPNFTCDYYASPTATASGTGSNSSPWELQKALNQTTLIRNGKTLCLKGGTYRGKFSTNLSGGGIVRSAPGEWAVIDGYWTTSLLSSINSTQTTIDIATTAGLISSYSSVLIDNEIVLVNSVVDGDTINVTRGWDTTTAASHSSGATVVRSEENFKVSGSDTTYRDFEIKNSWPRAMDGSMTPEAYDKVRGGGIIGSGNGNNYINLVVHDTAGIFIGGSASNTLIYGILTYNNGRPWHGQGLYLQNAAGYVRVYEAIALNNFNHGLQFYTTNGSVLGADVRGSIFANNGSPTNIPNVGMPNLLAGASNAPLPTLNIQDSHFYHPHTTDAGDLHVGYGDGVTTATVTGNYLVGGEVPFYSNTTNLIFTGNTIYSRFLTPTSSYIYNQSPVGDVMNNNTYYSDNNFRSRATVYGGFTPWKVGTGFDLNSTHIAGPMPNTAIVRPNTYQAGRANIVVYTANQAAAISVNLSSAGLTNGQAYIVKNAFNWTGPNVTSGVYNASSPVISLPLTGSGASVATPYGSGITPASTSPDFALFIVIPI